MLYFKNAPLSPREIDPAQLNAVEKFRLSLGELGALWWEFSDADEFEKHVRLHLSRVIQSFSHADERTALLPATIAEASEEDSESDEEELGILDLMEIYETRMAELTDISERIGQATEEIGQKVTGRTQEINALPRDTKGVPERSKAKKVLAKSASDMDQYASRIEAELPLFSSALNEGMDKLIAVIELSTEYGMRDDPKDIDDALIQIVNLQDTMNSSGESIRSFRDSVAALPPMTYEINHSKRRVVQVLDELLSEMAKGGNLLHEAELAFRKFQTARNRLDEQTKS